MDPFTMALQCFDTYMKFQMEIFTAGTLATKERTAELQLKNLEWWFAFLELFHPKKDQP